LVLLQLLLNSFGESMVNTGKDISGVGVGKFSLSCS
jgi:hypothetical protein